MGITPFNRISISEAKRKVNLREAFRVIGSTEIDLEYQAKEFGFCQEGLTLVEVLIMKLYRQAIRDDDRGALDRILRYCDIPQEQAPLVNIDLSGKNQLEHGAQAIFDRLQSALSQKPPSVDDDGFEDDF
jgi:hypothetical protein